MKPAQNKILYLEGLRGIAAFAVVIHHFILAFYPALFSANPAESHFADRAIEPAISCSPLSILYNGNFAVCIFFVLSGFVLSYKYFSQGDTNALFIMGIKRYPRLIIPAAASSILTYIVLKYGNIIPWKGPCFTRSDWWFCKLWPTDGNWWHFIKTTFINVPLKGSADYNTVLWTMEYEIKGSLLLIFFCLFVVLLRRFSWTLFLLCTVACFFTREFYYLSFISGIALCRLHNIKAIDRFFFPENKVFRFIGLTVLLFITIILGSFPLATVFPFSPYLSLPIKKLMLTTDEAAALYHSIGASALLLAVLVSASLKKLLSKTVFVYFGKISFSMYLLHVLILGLLMHLAAYMSGMQEGLPYHSTALAVFVVYLMLVFVFSELFYRGVDRPAVKFSEWFGRKAGGLIFSKK